MSEASECTEYRRALEALRNGVPNRDAVRILGLGTNQMEVEQRFVAQLSDVKPWAREGRQVPGLLFQGDFGSGKSHLLGYFQDLAVNQGFVCSRVVISKETALFDPGRVFRAAVESAVVPGRRGQAIHETALTLVPSAPDYDEFYLWANARESGLAPVFPATLLLHQQLNNDPELVEEIRDFWSGSAIAISKLRAALRRVRQGSAFIMGRVPVRELDVQRFSFAARLFLGAGFKGWVVLFDEVELIGRYSLLQRARSYAELARWMGRIEGSGIPGLTAVAAICEDFVPAVLEDKGDGDKAGARLRTRGRDEDLVVAAWAEGMMRVISQEAKGMALHPPSDADLRETYDRLKTIHSKAFQWTPPDVSGPEHSVSRAMRAYVRRWINEWDLARLYPGEALDSLELEVKQDYSEDADLERPPEPEDVSSLEGTTA